MITPEEREALLGTPKTGPLPPAEASPSRQALAEELRALALAADLEKLRNCWADRWVESFHSYDRKDARYLALHGHQGVANMSAEEIAQEVYDMCEWEDRVEISKLRNELAEMGEDQETLMQEDEHDR